MGARIGGGDTTKMLTRIGVLRSIGDAGVAAFRAIRGAALSAVTLATIAAGAPACAADPTSSDFSFLVIGDTPYSSQDEAMLARALPTIREAAYPFIVHIGDYKGGGQQCLDKFDDRMAALIEDLSPTPVFYTPGDNEWTDCDRHVDPETGEKYSDLARLEKIRLRFFETPPAGGDAFDYRRQRAQKENASWTHGGVRFVNLHVTGTNNGRDWVTVDSLTEADLAADRRDAANLEWLTKTFRAARIEGARAIVISMQADVTDIVDKPEDVMCVDAAPSDEHPCDAFTDLRRALRDEAIVFGGPVLLIHGDTAPFTLNQDMAGEDAPNLWRLNATGDAGRNALGARYGVRDVTEVTVTADRRAPFSARGLTTGRRPKKN